MTAAPQRHWTTAAQMSDKSNSRTKCRFEYHQHRDDIPVNDHPAMFLVA